MNYALSYADPRPTRAPFASPTSRLAPFVSIGEEQEPTVGQGSSSVWRRWIEIRILSGGVVFELRADARSLAFDAATSPVRGKAEVYAKGFDPLCAKRTLRCRGAEAPMTEPLSPELRAIAIDACRMVALRLYAYGVDRAAVTRPWPDWRPSFATIVLGEPPWRGGAEGGAGREPQRYPERKEAPKGKPRPPRLHAAVAFPWEGEAAMMLPP